MKMKPVLFFFKWQNIQVLTTDSIREKDAALKRKYISKLVG